MTLRKTILSILAIAVLAAAAVVGGYTKPTQAQDTAPANARFIRVTGNGNAAGAPDIAYMGIGVDSSDPDINVALADNNTRIEAIKAALGELGVEPTDVRTDYFNIWQDKGYYDPAATESAQATFRITHTMVVVIRDVSKVGEVLATVIDAGANVVNYVNFDIADRAALETEARVDALGDARDRAQQLADQLGAELGDVISIVEYNSGGYYGPNYGIGGGGGGGSASAPPISQGTLSVNIQLEVTFSIQ